MYVLHFRSHTENTPTVLYFTVRFPVEKYVIQIKAFIECVKCNVFLLVNPIVFFHGMGTLKAVIDLC